jgi:DNA-binding SARP family transcriptional activator
MEFCLLGPVEARRDGSVLVVPAGKQRVVLAVLLLNVGRAVPAAELTETLWGPRPPRTARVTLQNYVRRLRQALGDADRDRILTRPGGYLIRVEPGELDLDRFETLLAAARAAARAAAWDTAARNAAAALALWRGAPLADVESDALAAHEIPRLAELRLQALETRINADIRRHRCDEVIADLTTLTRRHPLRERLHALLILALVQDGRQAEALAAYQHARQVLIEELGAEPGPELRDLHMRILTGEPALA